jgi:hypothetical protein
MDGLEEVTGKEFFSFLKTIENTARAYFRSMEQNPLLNNYIAQYRKTCPALLQEKPHLAITAMNLLPKDSELRKKLDIKLINKGYFLMRGGAIGIIYAGP